MAEINWEDETTRRYLTGAVARPEPGDDRRRCFYVDDFAGNDTTGYVPCLVFEDEPGYGPMTGADPPRSTWYWGPTLEDAERICELVNAELFDLDPADALDIVGSSIEAQAAQA